MNRITVLDLMVKKNVEAFGVDFECIAGRQGMDREITKTINRPGLALNGKFVGFGKNRIQLFGRGEGAFLHQLEKEGRIEDIMSKFFAMPVSCCIFSHCQINTPPKLLIDYCDKTHCPLLYSELSSADISINLFRLLNDLFAPTSIEHGVLLEVYSLGVLIKGDSGVGKSEIALELIEKNKYRFIGDDVIQVKKVNDNTIVGSVVSAKRYHHNIEIRGLGFVNIAQIYGIGTILESKRVDMVVNLIPWEDWMGQDLERLEQIKYTTILGVTIPNIVLYIKAGRNVALLIETAAIKHRLKYMGYHGKENPYLW